MINHYKYFIIFFVCILQSENSVNFYHSGYTNVYAINRISDQSLIKTPFKLVNYDMGLDYKDFSFKTKIGLEHKLKTSNWWDISDSNVDYSLDIREYYVSYFPSFGEISIGKKLHAWGVVDANSPIDVLNPIDYYYLFTDSDETKIGRESISLDFFLPHDLKINFLFMPNHVSNNIPKNDPDFPITLPATVEDYQFLNMDNPIEYGGYIQKSFSNMDWTAYYFSGYDRNFNLYGANVFMDDWDVNSITDTIFSYRETEMIAISNVSFINDITLRADFAYFATDAGDTAIESRPYSGQNEFGELLEFNTLTATNYFDISAKYYQYCIQLEYGLPLEIDLTTQLFGYETIEVNGEEVDIDIPNFEISLDGKDLFYPGMGSSMATLAKQGLIFNFTKTILDDSLEIQSTHLLDLKDQGQLHQLKLSYNLIDNLDISFLFYKGVGNKNKYPDNPETEMNESLLYPFNAMEDFSHIRAQLQYFF